MNIECQNIPKISENYSINILYYNFRMIHLSAKKIKKLCSVEQKKDFIKPKGLWYSSKDIWLNYYNENIKDDNEFVYKYIYQLKLHTSKKMTKNKIYRIKDIKSFDNFTFEYGIIHKSKYLSFAYDVFIDWVKVSKYCAGIEVIPFLNERSKIRNKDVIKLYKSNFLTIKGKIKNISLTTWLYPFDVASGCVWNINAIKSIKQIKANNI